MCLLTEIGGEKDALKIAKKLITAIEQPLEISMPDAPAMVAIGVSIGIAISPKHGVNPEGRIRQADVACTRRNATVGGIQSRLDKASVRAVDEPRRKERRKGNFMNVYESIRNKIFHHQTTALASVPIAARPPLIQGGSANHIVGTLSSLAASNSQKLRWQSSIIDLMDLLGVDSSISNRRLLAEELCYCGDSSDAVAMDSWLHRTVMSNLAGHPGAQCDSARTPCAN